MHRDDQFIPELVVHNGTAALDFYKSVFSAEEVHRIIKPGSEKLVHGELILDGHKFFVCDEFPPSEGGTCKSPMTLGGTGVRITNQQVKQQSHEETQIAADDFFAKRK